MENADVRGLKKVNQNAYPKVLEELPGSGDVNHAIGH
jgi:hypothetical protein